MRKLKMKENQNIGKLITFCGLDGCGKTTMIEKLLSELGQSHSVFVTKQPTQFVRESEIFRTYMDSPDHSAYDYRSLSLMAASDRIQHVSSVINPVIEEGGIVLSDRYFYSCLANLRARGYKGDKWIYEISKFVIKPDLAFFFDVPVEKAVERVRKRAEEKERYIDLDLQYKLRREYIDICKRNGGILISTENSIDDCYRIVKKHTERILSNGKQ